MSYRLLRTKEVENAPIGERLNDGAGLRGVKRKGGVVWSWRGTLNKQQIEVGMGQLTLADARKKALDNEELVEQGIDPRVATRTERAATTSSDVTFGEYLDQWWDTKKVHELTNEKEKRVWRNTIRRYLPVICNMPIDQITLQDVANSLRPIWLDKPEMADRTRLRAAQVMKSATAIGLYDKVNPFDKDLLCEILPNIKREVKHHKAIPFEWAPEIYQKLTESNSQSAYALRCLMLTATRSNEGRGMAFSEVDEDEWTIPAERMKGGKAFTQVLSPAMFDLMDEVPKVSDRVFAGYGAKNDYVSCTSVADQVKRHAGKGYTAHGMRSCFKDWCAENGVDDRVSEVALSHKDKNKVRAAYLRTEFLPQRRRLMDDWGRYLLGYKS